MKVIKAGVDPKTILIVAHCSNCGTHVEFTQAEAEFHPADGYQSMGDSWAVRCPVCSYKIYGHKKSCSGGRYE